MQKKTILLCILMLCLCSIVAAAQCPTQDDFRVSVKKALFLYMSNPQKSAVNFSELNASVSFYLESPSDFVISPNTYCNTAYNGINLSTVMAKIEQNIPDYVVPACSDGTMYGECSAITQPLLCKSGKLVDKCNITPVAGISCGCPLDDCNISTGCCDTGCVGEYGTCNIGPYYQSTSGFTTCKCGGNVITQIGNLSADIASQSYCCGGVFRKYGPACGTNYPGCGNGPYDSTTNPNFASCKCGTNIVTRDDISTTSLYPSYCCGGVFTKMFGSACSVSDANCNGIDEDGANGADDGYVADDSCFKPGACAAANVASQCVAGIPIPCSTGIAAPNDANCNNIDDDCDGGTPDDDYINTPTTCGVGACLANGMKTCVSGIEQDSCVPGIPAPSEICGNSIDDDCINGIDDGCCPINTELSIAQGFTGSCTCDGSTITTVSLSDDLTFKSYCCADNGFRKYGPVCGQGGVKYECVADSDCQDAGKVVDYVCSATTIYDRVIGCNLGTNLCGTQNINPIDCSATSNTICSNHYGICYTYNPGNFPSFSVSTSITPISAYEYDVQVSADIAFGSHYIKNIVLYEYLDGALINDYTYVCSGDPCTHTWNFDKSAVPGNYEYYAVSESSYNTDRRKISPSAAITLPT
jgi:hypothetical protein